MFIPYQYQTGDLTPWVYLPVASGEWQVGLAAVGDSDVMVPVSAGTGQGTGHGNHYIAMFEDTVTDDDVEVRPFLLASSAGLVLESELSEVSAGLVRGGLYTIDATGTMVTATQTDGCCEVVDWDDTAAGSKIRVRVQ